MKKRIIVSFLAGSVVFLNDLLFSQILNYDETKFVKNRNISHRENMTTLKSRSIEFKKKEFSLNLIPTKKSKRVYLKLKESLTKAVENKLKLKGINFKEYVADDTYIVELDENKLDKLKREYSVTGFAEIDYADKLSERLYKGNFSNYAKDGNYVKVNVSFYDDISFEDAVNWINSIGGIVESKAFSRTHKLIISLHQLNIYILAELDIVKYADEVAPPITENNIDAGKLSNVFWDNDGGSLSGLYDIPYQIKGTDVKVAVRDGGKIYAHNDFNGRLTIVDNDLVSSHATHVAGTIGATNHFDTTPKTGSMAPSVNLYSYSYFIVGTNQNQQEASFADDFVSAIENFNASLINNSWGHLIGWYRKPNGQWTTDYSAPETAFGDYTSNSQDMDDLIFDYYVNNALIIKSAGNDRSDGPDSINHDGKYYLDDEGIASGYYDCVEPLGCAKNNITIGSVGTVMNNYLSSDFSSWGPTDDYRVKPDIVADGWQLRSTWDNDGYFKINGTSMSCPVVTGICALIHEAFNDQYGRYPTADIVKALLCNFAEDLGNPGPDFAYGFGLARAKPAIDAIYNLDAAEGGHIITGLIGEATDSMEYQIDIFENVNDSDPVTITLAWIDPAGNPAAVSALVNDLDIVVNSDATPNTPYNPFYFKECDTAPDSGGSPPPPFNPVEPAKTGQPNRFDTVEQLVIPLGDGGRLTPGTYTITVSGFKVPVLNQPFAVVSSHGFRGFHFNCVKIRDGNGYWVSNNQIVVSEILDILLMVTELGGGFDPSTIQYSVSTNNGITWSDWTSPSGVYSDQACTQQITVSPYIGTAYVYLDGIDFDQVSRRNNRVKFRVYYNQSYLESKSYNIQNDNRYYVSASYGNDNGYGTKENPWATIGHALTCAPAREYVPAIIRVAKGVYNENVYLGSYMRLEGGYDDSSWFRDLKDNDTVICAQGSNPALTADSNIIVDGFTVMGGDSTSGAGIYINGKTNVVISNCLIANNRVSGVTGAGAGLFAFQSSGTIKNCVFKENINNCNLAFGGAGSFSYSAFVIDSCVFESNSCDSHDLVAYGGALYFAQSPDSVVLNSIFKSNSVHSTNENYGGAIYLTSSSPVKILGSLFCGNCARKGSAIYCWTLTLANCTFYANITNDTSYVEKGSTITANSANNIFNCILKNNTANYGDKNYSRTLTDLNYSCIDNDGYTAGMLNNTVTVDDPMFKDPSNGDFRLEFNSPCINTGFCAAPGLNLLKKDINGNSRILCGEVDMGVCEYKWTVKSITADSANSVTLQWNSYADTDYYVEYSDDEPRCLKYPVFHLKMNDNDSTPNVLDNANGNICLLRRNTGGSINNRNTVHNSVAGKVNSALSFNGQEFIYCGNICNLTGDLSIAAWVKLEDRQSERTLIAKSNNGAYKLRIDADGNISMLIRDNVSQEQIKTTGYSFPLGEWAHIAVTLNFIDHQAKFYINGECIHTKTFTKNFIQVTSGELTVGAANTSINYSWKGVIDDLRLYNVVLSQDDIDIIYNSGSGIEDEKGTQWTRITPGIEGQDGTTSWIDDGSQTPALLDSDNDGIMHRYYRVVYEY